MLEQKSHGVRRNSVSVCKIDSTLLEINAYLRSFEVRQNISPWNRYACARHQESNR